MNDQTIVIPGTPGADDPAFAAGQAAEAARNAAEKAAEARAAGEAAQAAVAQAGTTLEALAGSLSQLAAQQAEGFNNLGSRVAALESRTAVLLDELAAELEADAIEEEDEPDEPGEDEEEAKRNAEAAEAVERERRAAPKGRHRSGTPWL